MGNAIKCGGKLTEECIGEHDKRYDPDASNNLKDQSDLWVAAEGFYRMEKYYYGPDYQPQLLDPTFQVFE
jgi:hypothetical protein